MFPLLPYWTQRVNVSLTTVCFPYSFLPSSLLSFCPPFLLSLPVSLSPRNVETSRSVVKKLRFAPGKGNLKMIALYNTRIDIREGVRSLSSSHTCSHTHTYTHHTHTLTHIFTLTFTLTLTHSHTGWSPGPTEMGFERRLPSPLPCGGCRLGHLWQTRPADQWLLCKGVWHQATTLPDPHQHTVICRWYNDDVMMMYGDVMMMYDDVMMMWWCGDDVMIYWYIGDVIVRCWSFEGGLLLKQ